MGTPKSDLDLWVTDLDAELNELDLWDQLERLEGRIARADQWLRTRADARPATLQRLEALVERHAATLAKIEALENEDSLIGIVLPADFGGAVPVQWERLPDDRILAWFTRQELAAAVSVNRALAEMTLDTLAPAA